MSFSQFWKQLKKRLRLKRRWLSLGIWLLLIGAALASIWLKERPTDNRPGWSEQVQAVQGHVFSLQGENAEPGHQEQVLERIRAAGGEREVYLQKNYVCGEEVIRLGRMNAEQISETREQHPQSTVVLNREGHVFFVQQVEDLSPDCKENAYFGIDRNGNLSLFDGEPERDKVLRTFFQLDMGHLESSLPQETVNQLREGIKITDLAEYNSVLSTFSEFAAEKIENVLKPS